MKLADVRVGVADVLRANVGQVQVAHQWPDAMAVSSATWLVVLPGDPYVTYSNGSGFAGRNTIRLRVVVLPLQAQGADRVQTELDDLLSCGADAPRSIRSALATDLSLGGTSCSVTVVDAAMRAYPIDGREITGAEVALTVEARC